MSSSSPYQPESKRGQRVLVVVGLLLVGMLALMGVGGMSTAVVVTRLAWGGALLLAVGIVWQVGWLWRQWQASASQLAAQQQLNHDGHAAEQAWQTELTAVRQDNETLRQQQELNSKLIALARATATSYTLPDTLHSILRVTSHLIDAEIGSLLILDASGQITTSLTSYGYDNIVPDKTNRILEEVMEKGLAGWVWRTREPALIRDTRQDERWITLPGDQYQAGSVLSVPILTDGLVSGILTLAHHAPNHFHQEDMTLMRSAAEQLAQTLGNAQVFEGQRRMLELHTVVSGTLQAISTHLDPRDVMQAAVDSVREMTDWPLVAIYLPDAAQTALVRQAYSCQTGQMPPSLLALPAAEASLIQEAFRQQSRRTHFNAPAAFAPYPALFALPLSWRQDKIGLLLVAHPEAYGLTEDDLPLAVALAESVSLALHNAYLFRAVSDERGRLQALIENTHNGVIMVGANQQILVINQMALHQFRLVGTPAAWEGRLVAEVTTAVSTTAPAAASMMRHLTQEVPIASEKVHTAELELPAQTIELYSLPVQVGGDVIGRLFLGRDVTEERALAHLREDLLHTMVHDLRNPLHMIASGLDLLRTVLVEQDVLGGSESQMLDIARTSTERMLHLVNAILEINQLESRRVPLAYRLFDLEQTVEMVRSLAQPMIQKQSLDFRVDFAAPTAVVWADNTLVERVLQNLVGNALKYTPPHGRVTVRVTPFPDAQGEQVKVSVIDSGPGISAELQNRLFEKFSRGNHQNTGSGLGLAFCKMAIEAHNQKIWVEETSPEGTTLSFTLALPPSG